MKRLLLGLIFALYATTNLASAATPNAQTYGLHLFFDETEFVDVLTITEDANGVVTGHMFVPNDFEANVDNLVIDGNHIIFDLFVPPNAARPVGMYFHYVGQFFDASRRQLTGVVTGRGNAEFIASFVAFLRE